MNQKTNASPRGPQSTSRPLTGRALRRAQGERNQRPQRQAWPMTIDGKFVVLLAPLNRALKRVSGGRTR